MKSISNQKKNIKILKPMFFNYFSINIFWMLYKIFIPLIFTFNAHSLFLFLLILIDLKFLNLILFYFIILYVYRILKSLRDLKIKLLVTLNFKKINK